MSQNPESDRSSTDAARIVFTGDDTKDGTRLCAAKRTLRWSGHRW